MKAQEPFSLTDSLLLIESWTSLNKNIVAGMTTRLDGISQTPFNSMNLGLHVEDRQENVIQNRKILAQKIGAPLTNWVCAEQIHGAKIAKVTSSDRGKGSIVMESAVKEVDGLYTFATDTFLMAMYADCVPLYFVAQHGEKSVVGVAHAGWRGTVLNIAGEMIKKWTEEENIPVQNIFVVIGPSIGKCCYIVDNHVIEQLAIVLNDETIHNVYKTEAIGQYRLDLKQANYELLLKAGVNSEHIEVSNYCTSCYSNLFFSHRRDQGKTGRMLSFIGMKNG